eukprot:TRINITY_DN1264_c0_g1_i9.p1 TRINITY_DN1264_c0_g1~~TRINITY_DN1264_c0_g1_i9.p1  ORF type:complete len:550 (-),score=32.55 TRINITY_DN1264_c0_g1_i9:196-1845(-)
MLRKQVIMYSQSKISTSYNKEQYSMTKARRRLVFEDNEESTVCTNTKLHCTHPVDHSDDTPTSQQNLHTQTAYREDQSCVDNVSFKLSKKHKTSFQATTYPNTQNTRDNIDKKQINAENNNLSFNNILNKSTNKFELKHNSSNYSSKKLQELQICQETSLFNGFGKLNNKQIHNNERTDEHNLFEKQLLSQSNDAQYKQNFPELSNDSLKQLSKYQSFEQDRHRKNLQSLEHFSDGYFTSQQNNFSGVTLTQSELDFMGGEMRNSIFQSNNSKILDTNKLQVNFVAKEHQTNFSQVTNTVSQQLNTHENEVSVVGKYNSFIESTVKDKQNNALCKNCENQDLLNYSQMINPLYSPMQNLNSQQQIGQCSITSPTNSNITICKEKDNKINQLQKQIDNLKISDSTDNNLQIQQLDLNTTQKNLQVSQLSHPQLQENSDSIQVNKDEGRDFQETGDAVNLLINALDVTVGDSGKVCLDDLVCSLDSQKTAHGQLHSVWRLLKMSKLVLQMLTDEIGQQQSQLLQKVEAAGNQEIISNLTESGGHICICEDY